MAVAAGKSEMVSDERWALSLIERCWHAIGDSGAWSGFLGELMDSTHACGVGLTATELAASMSGVELEWQGLDEACLRDYDQHYHHVDPWTARAKEIWQSECSGQTQGRPLQSDDMLARPLLEESEFGHDFLRAHRIADLCKLPLDERPDRQVVLALTRTDRPFEPQTMQRLALLVPHVQHAFRLARHWRSPTTLSSVAPPAREGIGIALVDRRLRVLARNDAAEALVETRFRTGVFEYLAFASEEEKASATAALARSSKEGPVFVRLQSSLPVLVVPHVGGPIMGLEAAATVAVLYLLPTGEDEAATDIFAQAFRLTPAEARVASLLSLGLVPKEIAQKLGVSWGTVRSHLLRLFKKTGVDSQARLVALYKDFALLSP